MTKTTPEPFVVTIPELQETEQETLTLVMEDENLIYTIPNLPVTSNTDLFQVNLLVVYRNSKPGTYTILEEGKQLTVYLTSAKAIED